MKNITEPTVRAAVVADLLADMDDQTERQNRIIAELARYEKHPEQAVIFAIALNLATLTIADKTRELVGERFTYNPKKAARNVRRGLRRKGHR